MRVLRKTKGELLRDLLEVAPSGAASSWTEEVLVKRFPFLDQDLPRSFSDGASLEGKRERASIMDLTDILLFFRDGEVGEVGVVGSGGVGVFGGVGCCCGFVSVHEDDFRDREKKDFESELRELKLLELLPGLRP